MLNRTVVLLLVLAVGGVSQVSAQELADYDYENLEFRGVSVATGGVFPTDVSSTVTVELRADLGYLGPHVRLVPRIAFWSSRIGEDRLDDLAEDVETVCERQGGFCGGVDLGRVRLSDLVLGLDAHYVWDEWLPSAYVGAGGSLHLLNGQGAAIDDTFFEEIFDALSPGIDLVAGASYPLSSSIELFVEGRYSLAGEVRFPAAVAGFSWFFPPPATPRPSMSPGVADHG